MTFVAIEGNDCIVGIKDGRLFITGVYRCCHGSIVDQVTIWLPLEFKSKLGVINDYDRNGNDLRFNLN